MNTNAPISTKTIKTILRHWLGTSVGLVDVKRLHGGMINAVLGLTLDVPPYRAVLKLSAEASFKPEAESLTYLRSCSLIPFPEVYCVGEAGGVVPEAFLAIEWMPGVHLGDAMMSVEERRGFDCRFAESLLQLHSHTRDTFGSLEFVQTYNHWLDWFGPTILSNYEKSIPHLTQSSLDSLPRLLELMPSIFESQGPPTLIHGDLWATNIMVENTSEGWQLSGLLDPGVMYADVEYELAYLECFQTVTPAFFDRYQQDCPMRAGYSIRRLYYWLKTMLLHVWLFGDRAYITRTERIISDLSSILKN